MNFSNSPNINAKIMECGGLKTTMFNKGKVEEAEKKLANAKL